MIMFSLQEEIGPTHDDITTESVADAFSKKIILNKKALNQENIIEKSDIQLNKSRLKMAYLPRHCF